MDLRRHRDVLTRCTLDVDLLATISFRPHGTRLGIGHTARLRGRHKRDSPQSEEVSRASGQRRCLDISYFHLFHDVTNIERARQDVRTQLSREATPAGLRLLLAGP